MTVKTNENDMNNQFVIAMGIIEINCNRNTIHNIYIKPSQQGKEIHT